MNAPAIFGRRIGHSFAFFYDSENEDVFEFRINISVLPHPIVGTLTTCQLVFGCI